MTTRIRDLLGSIQNDLVRVGGNLQPPASKSDIKELGEATLQKLGRELPSAYGDFLFETNGLSWGGIHIYATAKAPIVGIDWFIFGFLESNIALREASSLFQEYLVFGDDGGAMLTHNSNTNRFEFRTTFLTLLKQYGTFEEMLFDVLAQQL